MAHTNEQNTTEFIHNPDFVDWVLKPSAESDEYWEVYLIKNPSRKKDLEHARFIIKGLTHHQKSLSEAEVSSLWNKINHTDIFRTRRINELKRWSVAAGILLILGLTGWLMNQLRSSQLKIIDYQSIAVNINQGNDIKLILADHSEKTFATKEVELKYNQEGKLESKSGKQVQSEVLSTNPAVSLMNQLVVPRGRRSSIELADGTKLWLNSGSRAIYPIAFNGKTREIYIEGEGYLEVAHDATKPFYVVTDQVRVKVLGTKFDISAYKDDDQVSVVLVEGSIQASSGTSNQIMKPNQLLNFDKLTRKSTLKETNVLECVSWRDGWMLCNKEPMQSIVRKISRYYDIKINYDDLKINNITLTGKLDLKSNYEDVFNVICTTAPLNYEIIGNAIQLSMKQ